MDDAREFDELVDRVGIVRVWRDVEGRRHEVGGDTIRALLAIFGLDATRPREALVALDAAMPDGLPPIAAGFADALPTLELRLPPAVAAAPVSLSAIDARGHRSEIRLDAATRRRPDRRDRVGRIVCTIDWPFPGDAGESVVRLEGRGLVSEGQMVIAPACCWEPEPFRRGAGLAVQVYALRDRRDRPVGDLESLARVGAWFGRHGGAVVLANPLGGPVDPRAPFLEPYSPSSRLGIDPVYLPIESTQPAGSANGRIGDVAAIRRAALERLARDFGERIGDVASPEVRAFRAWCETEADWLEPHALFAARIRAAVDRREPDVAWNRWPPAWRDPRSPEVARWHHDHPIAVERERYAIWRLERAVLEADRRSRAAGLRLGLGHDLPLGCARHGAETWSQPEAFALEASLGAPPDPFCPDGQDWGLPPLRPGALASRTVAPWRRPLRAAMRRGGLVRFDHVMGLDRLWWIPPGGRPRDGAYVRYPGSLLLPLLVHDSHAHRCVVVGEDLGTVDPDLRQRLTQRGVLSTRVLRFERDDDGHFRPPPHYPERAWVAVGTHDLPGAIDLLRGGDRDPTAAPDASAIRHAEREALRAALQVAGATANALDEETGWLAALHRFLADTPARLVGVQAEDLLGRPGRVNVPGTVGPRNWSHRLDHCIEDWDGLASVRAVLEALSDRLGPARRDRSGAAQIPSATQEPAREPDQADRDPEHLDQHRGQVEREGE